MFEIAKRRNAALQRGDWVSRSKSTGRRVPMSACLSARGFSLIELVITITVLTIMTLGVMPLVKVAVRRQKEQQLREALRQMRTAIDEFHRDTIGMNCSAGGLGGVPQPGAQPGVQPGSTTIDPRSKVVISDCTIFGVDNPDHFPPTLETLSEGVNVIARSGSGTGGRGLQSTGTNPSSSSSVLDSQLATKKKVYLRELPIDPITGKKDWDLKSCYDATDSTSWGGENVFDVRSKSKAKSLNGEQYSDW
ncbi:MAG TPA: type II secretion system protein [Pyrinomonadaceae bacterium]|jgi:prepilin-type N-terminal cleavage/methylation domain|nr:type II secretion system protein [Pyrinomonadaceae bacterium]